MAKKKTSRKKTTRKKTVKKTSSKPKTKAKKKKIDNDDDFEEDGPEYIEEDLDELEDDMLADEGGVKKRSMDEIEMMLRDVECSTCEGNSSRENCKVRDDYGCPPDKVDL